MIFFIDKKREMAPLGKILYLQQKNLFRQRMKLSPPLAKQKYVGKIELKTWRKLLAILYWQRIELNPRHHREPALWQIFCLTQQYQPLLQEEIWRYQQVQVEQNFVQ